ncbi:unnamed protein product [Thelazia callipaeda]|uniref:Uncharacterized protein n=1 Tax=Thelazia callipaeda TaxID=103827 RepID=A0A0N5CZ61_THECL|nr:unnamed protein product [Thelazia callipaeda]
MADMELRAFETRLDTMVDQIGEESTELIIERPRFAHAVMVFANSTEAGELFTASRIKMLDPIYVPVAATTNGHQTFHHYSESMNTSVIVGSTSDSESEVVNQELEDDIQKALRKLEESRNLLDEPITLNSNASHIKIKLAKNWPLI